MYTYVCPVHPCLLPLCIPYTYTEYKYLIRPQEEKDFLLG